jgi:hypothetical protein
MEVPILRRGSSDKIGESESESDFLYGRTRAYPRSRTYRSFRPRLETMLLKRTSKHNVDSQASHRPSQREYQQHHSPVKPEGPTIPTVKRQTSSSSRTPSSDNSSQDTETLLGSHSSCFTSTSGSADGEVQGVAISEWVSESCEKPSSPVPAIRETPSECDSSESSSSHPTISLQYSSMSETVSQSVLSPSHARLVEGSSDEQGNVSLNTSLDTEYTDGPVDVDTLMVVSPRGPLTTATSGFSNGSHSRSGSRHAMPPLPHSHHAYSHSHQYHYNPHYPSSKHRWSASRSGGSSTGYSSGHSQAGSQGERSVPIDVDSMQEWVAEPSHPIDVDSCQEWVAEPSHPIDVDSCQEYHDDEESILTRDDHACLQHMVFSMDPATIGSHVPSLELATSSSTGSSGSRTRIAKKRQVVDCDTSHGLREEYIADGAAEVDETEEELTKRLAYSATLILDEREWDRGLVSYAAGFEIPHDEDNSVIESLMEEEKPRHRRLVSPTVIPENSVVEDGLYAV